jgi:hypothetical protein
LLLAASGACKFDGLNAWGPVPPPSNGSHLELTMVTVTPSTVRARSQFAASASTTFGGCDRAPAIVVIYGDQSVIQNGPAFQSSFTALLDQTIVDFHAFCVTPSGGPIVTPNQYIHITVAKAP